MTNGKLVLAVTTCIVSLLLIFSSYLGFLGSFNSGTQTRNLNVPSEIAAGAPASGYGSDPSRIGFYPVTITDGAPIPPFSLQCRGSGCGGNSSITVNSAYYSGAIFNGTYVLLEQDGRILATGFTPVTFVVRGSETYSIAVQDFANAYFYQWSDGVCSSPVSINVNIFASQIALTAIFRTTPAPPSSCVDPTGITVYAARISAPYWAPCFALVCTAGTGPGASMEFILYDSSGNIIATSLSNENGHTFTGLTPGAMYYVYPTDCDLCHGSTHDVVFEYWNNDTSTVRPLAVTVGETLTAWYSCTNNCTGG